VKPLPQRASGAPPAADLEAEIRALHAASAITDAARRAIEGYGPEVLGFLRSTLRDEDQAGDVFADACEDLWRGLPAFAWRCSLRTWFYTLARHAAARWRRAPHRRPGRHAALSEVSEVAEQVRTRTLTYLRTAARDKLDELRASLAPEDHELLVLRVSRGLSWQEVARVLGPADTDDSVIAREAARLRKRFQLLKERLRAQARSAGLLE
jgi:RNA polymerase sigma-70 factor (ECF subfamily)